MKVAQVVPLRRMPAHRPWLTYRPQPGVVYQVGQLVDIPLRGKTVPGIIWALEDQDIGNLVVQDVGQPIVSAPLFTDWQRQVIATTADCSSMSLAHAVSLALPSLTKRSMVKYFSGQPTVRKQSPAASWSGALWYRQRSDGVRDIVQTVQSATNFPALIVTPTETDAQQIVSALADRAIASHHVYRHISPTNWAAIYQRVRLGEQLVVVGDLTALLLPWLTPPLIYLDQEEHPAHKNSARYPHDDVRVILEHLGKQYRRSTVSPLVSTFARYQEIRDTQPSRRHVISLSGKHAAPFITEELLTVIDETVAAHRRVACIAPRTGYASSTLCRACGTALACPTCGRRVSLVRGIHAEAKCTACKTVIPLQLSCKKCGSSTWRVQGLGVEYMTQSLATVRPDLRVAPVALQGVDADIVVDTYQSYQHVSNILDLAAVCILNGDSMLTAPDFSVSERAWQYLARLEAATNGASVYAQTFEESSNFWQRWAHGDDSAFYRDERIQRQRLGVPPAVRQWIAAARVSPAEADTKILELQTAYGTDVSARKLPARFHTPSIQRLLITLSSAEAEPQVDWRKFFALPWHVDRWPTSWLD